MPNRLLPIQRWFFPRLRRFTQTQAGVRAPEGAASSGAALWLLSRRFAQHHVFTLPDSVRSDRWPEALALMVRKWSPHARPGFVADWAGPRASVFVWDEAAVETAARGQGLALSALTVLPETVLREKGENGLRLVEALDGFEAQHWADGFLLASRWWPALPNAAQWQTFLRAAGLDGATPLPQPVSIGWAERPWIRQGALLTILRTAATPERLAAALAVLLLAPAAFFLAKLAIVNAARGDVEAQIAREARGAETILEARRVATVNRGAIEQLVKLQTYPPPLAQMAQASGIVAATTLKTEAWEYENGSLSLQLRGKADTATLVRQFEDSPMFAGVSSASAGGENVVTLRMNVEPAEKAFAAAPVPPPAPMPGSPIPGSPMPSSP